MASPYRVGAMLDHSGDCLMSLRKEERDMAKTATRQSEVKLTASKIEKHYIERIAKKFIAIYKDLHPEVKVSTLDVEMDVTAVHCNGNKLKLYELLYVADRMNFLHDVVGIINKVDRNTGQLKDCFVPRYSLGPC
jgi:hypothetical protein